MEDCAEDVFLLKLAMRKAGLEQLCRFVVDGAEAIAYMNGDHPFADRNAHPFPHMVILDLALPRIDGFGVLQWMRTTPECNGVKTIVWSDWEYGAYIEKARRAGARIILRKKFGEGGMSVLVGMIALGLEAGDLSVQ